MMRDPPSQDRTIFCASCPCGPAAGPSGVAARSPWKDTERSSPGISRKNLLFGKSKILPSRSYSRTARRHNRGKGIGFSSATSSSCCKDQRKCCVELRGCDQVCDRHALAHTVRHLFFTRPESD